MFENLKTPRCDAESAAKLIYGSPKLSKRLETRARLMRVVSDSAVIDLVRARLRVRNQRLERGTGRFNDNKDSAQDHFK